MKLPEIAHSAEALSLIDLALREDVGKGDLTTLALVPPDAMAKAVVISRSKCVVSGAGVGKAVFTRVDPSLTVRIIVSDGASAPADRPILAVRGHAGSILTAERTVLNFMQRMTGIATLTAEFVRRAKPYGVAVLDTRKTTPGLRAIEKYAVLCGGGKNHRMGLYDMILMKDNHRLLWGRNGARSIAQAIAAARAKSPGTAIEVEVENERELIDALAGSPDWVLLDNMRPAAMRRCVKLCAGRCKVEASGGIALAGVEAVARTGVDAISIGALTHSAPAADLSLEVVV